MMCQNDVKSRDPSKAADFRLFCDNLMKEMHWKKPDEKTVDLYAMKKHMMQIPELKEKRLMDMPKNDFEKIKESPWAHYCQ